MTRKDKISIVLRGVASSGVTALAVALFPLRTSMEIVALWIVAGVFYDLGRMLNATHERALRYAREIDKLKSGSYRGEEV